MPIFLLIAGWIASSVTKMVVNLAAKVGFSAVLAGLGYAVMAFRTTIVISSVSIVLWIFYQINSLFSYVDNLNISSGSTVNVNLALDVVKSLGLWDAFVDAFSIFSPVLILLLTVKMSTIGLRFVNALHVVVREQIKIATSHGIR